MRADVVGQWGAASHDGLRMTAVLRGCARLSQRTARRTPWGTQDDDGVTRLRTAFSAIERRARRRWGTQDDRGGQCGVLRWHA